MPTAMFDAKGRILDTPELRRFSFLVGFRCRTDAEQAELETLTDKYFIHTGWEPVARDPDWAPGGKFHRGDVK